MTLSSEAPVIDHARDKASPPNNLRETGSAYLRPYALIARDRIGHESVFVTELLSDRIVLRAGPKGYSVHIRKDDRWYVPSDRSVCCRSIGSREAIVPAALQAAHVLKEPLSDEESEAVIAAIEDLPTYGQVAHNSLRVRVGNAVTAPKWMHPRFNLQVRSALRGY